MQVNVGSRFGSGQKRGRVLWLVPVLVLAGCLGPGGTDPDRDGATDPQTAPPSSSPASASPTGARPPAGLDSRLYGLVTAGNRSAYATENGLDLRDGRVLVVLELREGRSLPAAFDLSVQTRYDGLVQALVPVDELVDIADHGNVSFVRPPRPPATASSSDHSDPCSLPPSPSGSQRSPSYCSW